MNTNLDRRDFLKVSTVAGAGLMLGFYLPSKENGLTPASDFAPNAFIKIEPSGTVTIAVAKSEMGQGVRTSLPMIVAEELDADWSKVRVEQSDAHPTKYGSQGTGGSFSVRGSWQMLRQAGATARDMLVTAAAQSWHVSPATCKTDKGFVIHSSGKKLAYGELAEAASKLSVPHSVKLKENKDFKILGKSLPRVDTPEKVTGAAKYGIDVRLPGMLFASIEKCPVFGGKVKSYDDTKAKAVSGVRQIVNVENGVAVVANSTYAAFKGREALTITWDEGQWANQTSAGIKKMFEDAVKQRGSVEDYDGDAESAFESAATKVEAIYEVPLAAHATMEPMNCTAHVQKDRCEIWAPTQSPQQAQSEAARILGLSLDKVTLHITLLGGGFGRRLNSDFVQDAVKVAKAVDAPVQVVWKREDDMQHDWYRPATYNVMRGGLNKDGWPVAWLHRVAGPSSRGLVVGGTTPPYNVQTFMVDSHIKETGVPIGAWRAVGPSQNGWVMESFIDELAHAAKKDPFEYRRQLLNKSPRLKRALEVAAEKAGWGKPLPKGMGRGIAAVEGFGSSIAQVAEVSVDKDGTLHIHRVVCAVDCGPVVNPNTIEAQLESAIVYAMSAAFKDEITIDKGRVVQSNFDDYSMPMMKDMPKVEAHIIPSTDSVGGIGEPALPPLSPAVCNAIFAATGKRIRRLPIRPEDLKQA